jgi:hypothetical protein
MERSAHGEQTVLKTVAAQAAGGSTPRRSLETNNDDCYYIDDKQAMRIKETAGSHKPGRRGRFPCPQR